MRVCQPGPVAFQRASVAGDNLRLIATFDSGDFGRPRGLSIAAAVRAPKILGRTSFAGRALAIIANLMIERVDLVAGGLKVKWHALGWKELIKEFASNSIGSEMLELETT